MKKGPLFKSPSNVYSVRIPDGETYASLCEKHPEIEAVPYEQRGLSFLKQTCRRLGIRPHETRSIMLERLNRPLEETITNDLAKRVFKEVPVYTAEHQQNTTRLPHEVVRIIFGYTDAKTLFSALYTAKYLHEDALHWIWIRAKELIGPKATPMALSFFLMYDSQNYRNLYSKHSKASRNHYRCFKSNHIVCGVQSLIAQFGSIEGYKADLQRIKKLANCRTQERNAILETASDRYEECMAILDQLQLPHVIMRVAPKYELTVLFYVILEYYRDVPPAWYDHYKAAMEKCVKYINKHQPMTTDSFKRSLKRMNGAAPFQFFHTLEPHLKFTDSSMKQPNYRPIWVHFMCEYLQHLNAMSIMGMEQIQIQKHAQYICKTSTKIIGTAYSRLYGPSYVYDALVVYNSAKDTFYTFYDPVVISCWIDLSSLLHHLGIKTISTSSFIEAFRSCGKMSVLCTNEDVHPSIEMIKYQLFP